MVIPPKAVAILKWFGGESAYYAREIVQITNIMSENIILTTGLYDLIKDHLRRKKVTIQEEELLIEELKNAEQTVRKEIPEDVVILNKTVSYKNHSQDQVKTVTFVMPDKSKPSKNKISIFSDEGIAMVGRKAGSTIVWPSKKGELKLEILKVEEAK